MPESPALDQRTVLPAQGRRVRHPGVGLLLAASGALVTWGSYWERLLKAGDIVVSEPEAAPAAAKPAPKSLSPVGAADAPAAVKDA
jgi:hypothetical protein